MWNRILSCLFAVVVGLVAPQAFAADTTSTLLKLLIMGSGLHNNDWGNQTNTNLQAIESAIAGIGSYSVSGGTMTLTDPQALPAVLAFTGTLSSNQTIVLPNHSRIWIVFNSTSGAYTLTLKAAGAGTTINVAQGTNRIFISDGTNVYDASPPVIDAVPVGAMLNFAGATLPANYAWCDGSTYSRTAHASLFTLIGTTYGVGDGITTANLPDARGRVLAMPDGGAGRLTNFTATLGNAGGEQNHTLSLAEMPSHNHTAADSGHNHGVNDPGHSHGAPGGGQWISFVGSGSNTTTGFYGPTGNSYVSSSTGVSTTNVTVQTGYANISVGYAGSSTAHNVVQPTLISNCIIRVQ